MVFNTVFPLCPVFLLLLALTYYYVVIIIIAIASIDTTVSNNTVALSFILLSLLHDIAIIKIEG